MEKIQKTRLVDRVEKHLEEQIRAGVWNEFLPSTRVLSKSLGVSAPTLAEAVKRLVDKGVLIHRGQRRALGIGNAKTRKKAQKRKSTKCILLVVPDHIEMLECALRDVIHQFLELLLASGWSYQTKVIDFLSAKNAHKSWSSGFIAEDFDTAVVVSARHSVVEWLESTDLPYVALGGFPNEIKFPVVGVRAGSMVSEALDLLMNLGHRRIFTPICDHEAMTVDTIRGCYRRAYDEIGCVFQENQQTPVSDYSSREVLWDMTARAFETLKPTAMILAGWDEFTTISCLLKKLNLEIPRDVSIMLIDYDPLAEWFVPKIAGYQYPSARLAKQLMRWATSSSPIKPEVLSFDGEWDLGESVAEAPKA